MTGLSLKRGLRLEDILCWSVHSIKHVDFSSEKKPFQKKGSKFFIKGFFGVIFFVKSLLIKIESK